MRGVEAFIFEFGDRVIAALEKSLPRKTDATGNLRGTMRFTVRKFGINYTFELFLADYWRAVDAGQKPGHHVPVEDLIKWIKVKGLATKTKGYESKLQKFARNRFGSIRNMAYAVQEKIFEKGTKGTRFYSKVIPGLVDDFRKELPKRLAEDLKIDIIDSLK